MTGATASAGGAHPALRLRGIRKSFGEVRANDGVDFEVARGEIHGLVGENGAGKSTLMRILFGLVRADAGTIELDGSPILIPSPSRAIGLGLGMVHQHFMLVPSFTVAENVTLGAEPGPPGIYGRVEAARTTRRLAARIGLVDLDPEALTGSLSIAMQQKVEIIKVLHRGARILILDEPTAVLTPQETAELFALLRRLADEGTSVVFISHKLPEVLAIADRVTVMRQGRTTTSVPADGTSAADLVSAMTGRNDVRIGRVKRRPAGAGQVLRLDDVSSEKVPGDSALDRVSITVNAGEIVGVAGVEGNGQTTLADLLLGIAAVKSGRVLLGETEISRLTVRQRRDAGLAAVPEDRHTQGLPLEATVAEALLAGDVRDTSWRDPVRAALPAARRNAYAARVARDGLVASGIDALNRSLSGGNQQKVVLSRELAGQPRVILLSQPTRGVDIGAIEAIYDRIADETDRGAAVLLISADLDELFRLADRMVVLFRGRIAATVDATTVTKQDVGGLMMGLAS